MQQTIYISEKHKATITLRQQTGYKTAWALHVNGQYMGTKILPYNNTAIPQNFGYLAADFTKSE